MIGTVTSSLTKDLDQGVAGNSVGPVLGITFNKNQSRSPGGKRRNFSVFDLALLQEVVVRGSL